jgi:hypothetical protein
VKPRFPRIVQVALTVRSGVVKHDPRLHERVRRLIKRGVVEKVIAHRFTEAMGASIVHKRVCREETRRLEVLLVAVTRDFAFSRTLAEASVAFMLCFALTLPPAWFGIRITRTEKEGEYIDASDKKLLVKWT